MRNLIDGIRIARVLNRVSSDRLVSIAQRAIKSPQFTTDSDIKSLAASVLSQAKPGRVMRDEGDVIAGRADDDWQDDSVQGQGE